MRRWGTNQAVCLLVVCVALGATGCATASQTKEVELAGGAERVPEGPILDRSAVEEMCPDEPFACALGGLLYLEGDESKASSGPGQPRAGELLRKACEAELPVACATLASMHVTGRGVARDLARAEALYERACSQDGAFGCMGLGRMHETGAAMAKNARRAGELYERACALGGGEGCFRLWQWRRSFGTSPGAFTAAARGCALTNNRCCEALEDQYDIDIDEDSGRAKLVRRLDAACGSGELAACELLGRHYESGDAAVRDLERAGRMYRRACGNEMSIPVPRACSRLGALSQEGAGVTQDNTRAATLFERSCEAGWSVGCSHLAAAYEEGAGVEKQVERAQQLYRRACARGHAKGCLKVGGLLEPEDSAEKASGRTEKSGESSKDTTDSWLRAAIFYQIGCSSGSAAACNTLGVVLERREAFEVASRQVARLYQRSCRMGHAEGCFNLAAAYRAGEGVDRSASEALTYFRRACDKGMTKACQYIGLAEESSGRSEGERYEEALRTVVLLENACRDDAARGCTRAGMFHREGRGGLSVDQEAAVNWFEKGCKQGDPDACAQYGYQLQEGLGIERNVTAAAKQYAVACKGGSASACTYLGALYASGQLEAEDAVQRAAELFKSACDEGDASGCLRLGRMLRGSREISVETAGAEALFERACEKGLEEACKELKKQ